jgi:hypothetical protein
LRKLELVLPSQAALEEGEAPTGEARVETRKRPTSVHPLPTADEVAPRPEFNETTSRTPWSFIDEIESHAGLYTVAELAMVLQRSTCSIYRMAHRKQLPSLRVGGLLYFDPAALGMFFRKKSPESAAAARFRSRLPPTRFSGVSQKSSQPR